MSDDLTGFGTLIRAIGDYNSALNYYQEVFRTDTRETGRVSEVSADGQKVWIVNVQDDDNLVIARIADKSLDELAHYQTHATEKHQKKGQVVIPQ